MNCIPGRRGKVLSLTCEKNVESSLSVGQLILKDGEINLDSIVLVMLLTLVSTLIFFSVAAGSDGSGSDCGLFH